MSPLTLLELPPREFARKLNARENLVFNSILVSYILDQTMAGIAFAGKRFPLDNMCYKQIPYESNVW